MPQLSFVTQQGCGFEQTMRGLIDRYIDRQKAER